MSRALPPAEDRAVAASPSSPSVSPVPASIPSADGSNWTRKTVATWEDWQCGRYRAFKSTFDGPWNLEDGRNNIILTNRSLQVVMAHAQARALAGEK